VNFCPTSQTTKNSIRCPRHVLIDMGCGISIGASNDVVPTAGKKKLPLQAVLQEIPDLVSYSRKDEYVDYAHDFWAVPFVYTEDEPSTDSYRLAFESWESLTEPEFFANLPPVDEATPIQLLESVSIIFASFSINLPMWSPDCRLLVLRSEPFQKKFIIDLVKTMLGGQDSRNFKRNVRKFARLHSVNTSGVIREDYPAIGEALVHAITTSMKNLSGEISYRSFNNNNLKTLDAWRELYSKFYRVLVPILTQKEYGGKAERDIVTGYSGLRSISSTRSLSQSSLSDALYHSEL